MRRSVFLSFCGIHAITVMNNRGRLKTDLNMGVASKETTCTVYMICIYVEIYGASACFFTRTQFKLQRRCAPRFDLPSQVNELTHAQCILMILAKISLCLASKKMSLNVILNQRFKTLILSLQKEHERILTCQYGLKNFANAA